MDRERIDLWCERGILALVLSILMFGPLAIGAVIPLQFCLIQALTVGILGLWILRIWVSPKPKLLWPPICWAVLAFGGYVVYRYSFSEIEYLARLEMVQVIVYCFLFFAVLHHLYRRQSTWVIIIGLLVLATGISLYACYQYLAHSNRIWTYIQPLSYAGRASGTYVCPNHLAGFLEMILPVAVALIFVGRVGHASRLVLIYSSLVICAGIGVTISRAGWVVSALSLILLMAILVRSRWQALLAAVSILILSGAAYYFYGSSVLARARVQNANISGESRDIRFRYWPVAVEIWQENPWWGGGGGHFDYRFRMHRPIHNEVQNRVSNPHNDYLNALADYGLVGVGIIGAALGCLGFGIYRCREFMRRKPGDLDRKGSNREALFIGMSVGILAICLHSIVDFNMHIPANAILAITLMALITGFYRFATTDHWITLRVTGRLIATLVLLAGIYFLSMQDWQRYREQRWLDYAKQSKTQDQQMMALKNAYSADPMNFETTYTIGEVLRQRSWEGNDDYKSLALEAMPWFRIGMDSNPLSAYNFIRYGMCLHWIGRHAEAATYFKRAEELDPNSYYTLGYIGWHYFQLGNTVKAREYFKRSANLNWWDNRMAFSYLKIIDAGLKP